MGGVSNLEDLVFSEPILNEPHMQKTAGELEDMRKYMRSKTEATEKNVMEWIKRSLDSLIHMLQQINRNDYGGKKLNINIEGINAENERLKNQVIGYIGNRLEERLVLTDKELSVILNERDDKKRKKNFDGFVLKIEKEALKGLKKEIQNTVEKQQNMVEKEIKKCLEEVHKNMQKAKAGYEELLNAQKQGEKAVEEMQIKYMYELSLFQTLEEQLGEC